jgi:hypothetical protein
MNPHVPYRTHNTPLLVPIQTHIDSVHKDMSMHFKVRSTSLH